MIAVPFFCAVLPWECALAARTSGWTPHACHAEWVLQEDTATELSNDLQSSQLLEDTTTSEDQSEKIHKEGKNMLYLWQR